MQQNEKDLENQREQVAKGFCPGNASAAVIKQFEGPPASEMRKVELGKRILAVANEATNVH